MEDSMRNIRNILAQGRQQLKQVMESLQNNARINGANAKFTDCLRECQELGLAFHTDMSFKDFCTIKHPEWYEPQLSGNKKGKVHIVEVHYDSEDEEVHENATTDAYLEQSDEASDSCASEGQFGWTG
jgi:hypothetical protein